MLVTSFSQLIRAETYLSNCKQEETAAHNQRRKDLFWALYSLDRLAAFIFNQSPCLADSDIDVDVSFVYLDGLSLANASSSRYRLQSCGPRANTPPCQARHFGYITYSQGDYMVKSRILFMEHCGQQKTPAKRASKRLSMATCSKYSNGI